MPDQVSHQISQSYDATPYDSHPYAQTAPEHLEALAHVFGIDTPPPATARVLELGCAAGGNLMPFAARFPQATAVGVDLSPVQASQGAQAARRAGLENVRIHAFDIADIDDSFGTFDYIICHGVYSWVPSVVQDAILRVCARHLTPRGVACISYNVHPGWKAREIVRDAMMLRGGPRDTPEDKLAYGRGMLEFLAQSARPGSVLKATLDEMVPLVRDAGASYLIHEFFETCNAPCYFKQFVARAETQGLAYLADADSATMFIQNYSEAVREPLLRECGASQVMLEQYLDFLVNRSFRQTLLVHRARAPEIRYRLDPQRLRALCYAGVFRAEDGGAFRLDAVEQPCVSLRNVKVTLRLPVHKAVAQVLDACYPAMLPAPSLIDAVAARMDAPSADVAPDVMAMLEELLILGAVRVRLTPVRCAAQMPLLPRALAAVRTLPTLPLGEGAQALACNLWHESVALSPVERCLLPWLDGGHTHEQLAQRLVGEALAGRIRFMVRDGQPLAMGDALRAFAQQQVDLALRDLRRKGMLLA